MNISNLFKIANAAKQIQAYDIANAAFAVIAHTAIAAQQCGKSDGDVRKTDAFRVAFLFESDSGDLIESLSNPDGAGYYDLPRLSFWGDKLMGTNAREGHTLCIPLPLVNRSFCNSMLRLIAKDDPLSTSFVNRQEHNRNYWHLSGERVEMCRRDLLRRLTEECSEEYIEMARIAILREDEVSTQEDDYADMVEYLGPSTLKKLSIEE